MDKELIEDFDNKQPIFGNSQTRLLNDDGLMFTDISSESDSEQYPGSMTYAEYLSFESDSNLKKRYLSGENILIQSSSEAIRSSSNSIDKKNAEQAKISLILLPDEIILLIMRFLPQKDMINILYTAKRFEALSRDSVLITSWLRHHTSIDLPIVNTLPISAFYWLKLHTILSRKKTIGQWIEIFPDNKTITIDCQTIDELEKDFCRAAIDFWQKLIQAEQALQQAPGKANIDWLKASPLAQQSILRLLLLHQFPTWNISADLSDDKQQILILQRQALIVCLVEKGFLPNYNNAEIRAKLANKNLALFPFLSIQDGVIWHEAMQSLYEHDAFTWIKAHLSQAIMSHFKLLIKQGAKWANAYLAAKLMTVCMSEKHDYGTSINHLMVTLDWFTTKLPSSLFAQYATGVGQLVFKMLEPFNDYEYDFKLNIFRDFRSKSYLLVSSSNDAAGMVHRFLVRTMEQKTDRHFNYNALMKCMENAHTLSQSIMPYVKKNAKAVNEEDDFDYFYDPIFGNDYLLENDDASIETIPVCPEQGQEQSKLLNISKFQKDIEKGITEKPRWSPQLWKSQDTINTRNEGNKFEEPQQVLRKTKSG